MNSLVEYFDVIPAKAGIQQPAQLKALDSGFRRNDKIFSGSL
jgi:hypothetical protein